MTKQPGKSLPIQKQIYTNPNMLEYKKMDQPAALQDSHSQKQQPGKNLSRMVRRREIKRDRNNVSVGGNVVLKTPSGRPQLQLLRKLLKMPKDNSNVSL